MTSMEVASPLRSVAFIQADRNYAQPLLRLARSADLSAATFDSIDDFIERSSNRDSVCVVVASALLNDLATDLSRLERDGDCPPSHAIILSEVDDAGPRQDAHRLGAAAFLHEPVDGEALLDAIRWVHCRIDENAGLQASRSTGGQRIGFTTPRYSQATTLG